MDEMESLLWEFQLKSILFGVIIPDLVSLLQHTHTQHIRNCIGVKPNFYISPWQLSSVFCIKYASMNWQFSL
jgi:hypothetical protein